MRKELWDRDYVFTKMTSYKRRKENLSSLKTSYEKGAHQNVGRFGRCAFSSLFLFRAWHCPK